MYENLEIEMTRNKVTKRAIANHLGIHENSLSYKLTHGSISIEEAFEIKRQFFPNFELSYLFATKSQSA